MFVWTNQPTLVCLPELWRNASQSNMAPTAWGYSHQVWWGCGNRETRGWRILHRTRTCIPSCLRLSGRKRETFHSGPGRTCKLLMLKMFNSFQTVSRCSLWGPWWRRRSETTRDTSPTGWWMCHWNVFKWLSTPQLLHLLLSVDARVSKGGEAVGERLVGWFLTSDPPIREAKMGR